MLNESFFTLKFRCYLAEVLYTSGIFFYFDQWPLERSVCHITLSQPEQNE